MIIGATGALCYSCGCYLLNRFEIDDPLEASAVHLSGGTWGTIAVGLFNNEVGLFYTGNGKQLGYQILGIISIFAWVSIWVVPFFLTMKKLNLLRVPKEIEIVGLDIAELGGVSEEVYNKLKRDFGITSRDQSIAHSPSETSPTFK